MNIIVYSNDDSYYYLYKEFNNKFKYLSEIKDDNINCLVFSKLDNNGYIKDTKINLEKLLASTNINKIFVEEDSIYLNKLINKCKIKYKVINENSIFQQKINELRSMILLKYILEDNKETIYNLNILVLGNTYQSKVISNLLNNLNIKNETYNKEVHFSLDKYDVVINTDNLNISNELLFNIKKKLVIYDLNPYLTKIDKIILQNNCIKYKCIYNVSLYLPKDKAKLIYDVILNEGI